MCNSVQNVRNSCENIENIQSEILFIIFQGRDKILYLIFISLIVSIGRENRTNIRDLISVKLKANTDKLITASTISRLCNVNTIQLIFKRNYENIIKNRTSISREIIVSKRLLIRVTS